MLMLSKLAEQKLRTPFLPLKEQLAEADVTKQILRNPQNPIVPDSETHPKVGKDPSPATDNRHALAVFATSVEEPTPMAESAQQKGKSAETAEKSDTLILYAGLQLSAPLNKMMTPMLTTSLPTSLIRRMSFTPQSYLPVR